MTHPLFRQDLFIETAFARRFQAMLRSAWRDRSWHVIVADPGAGKTMSIRDLRKTAGGRSMLAITTPKNNEEEQALGDQLYTALGLPLRGYWPTRKPKLMGHLHQYGTEFLVVDDAHDLSLKHLMFIKELTDQGRLQYDHPLGLCLVAAGRGNTIPLKETLDMPETTWVQFRRRFDKLQPFCRIAGHTSEEVREILASLETVYQELFPQLNLRQWSGFIYTWLTQSTFDPTNSGRVNMDYLMKLVTTALEWSYQAGDTEIRAETLEQAASLLVLRRDTLRIIDGEGPSSEAPSSTSPSVAQTSKTEQVSSPQASPEPSPISPTEQADQPRSRQEVAVPATTSTKCTFLGVVPIDIKRFEESGVSLVECPDCGRTWTLSPRGGVVRFKSHDKRKTTASNAGRRWAMCETIWKVFGE
jgi:hypothetical protein